jgi:hypothetical protein
MTDRPKTFRMSFLTTYLMVMVWVNLALMLIIGLPVAIRTPYNQWWIHIQALGYGMLIGVVAEFVLCWVVVLAFPTRIYPDRLQTTDFWGAKQVVLWDDIGFGIQPFNMGGLRYLLLTVKGQKRRLWLPLFVRDKAGYIDAFAEAAGDDHHLTQAVRAFLDEREWRD